MELKDMMNVMLDHACPNSVNDLEGYDLFWIETHCVGFWIHAKKEGDTWHVLDYKAEDC